MSDSPDYLTKTQIENAIRDAIAAHARYSLSREEVKLIVRQALIESGAMTKGDIKDVVHETVATTFKTLGVDADNPLTVQGDMLFIRELRSASDKIRSRSLVVVVGMLVAAALGAIWMGVKAMLTTGH